MSKKNILVFTAARSDFGIMKNTIINLEKFKRFNFFLIVGSAHYSGLFGNTVSEIDKIKIKNKIKLNFKYSRNSSLKEITTNFTNTMINVQKIFEKKKIDCCLIMGDRYEMMALAIVCLNNNVPIAHICGGSETFGSIDNEYRNSISQMAKYHFVETKFHKKRLQKMGIDKNIFIVGAPALENLNKYTKDFKTTKKKYFLELDEKKKLLFPAFTLKQL